MKRSRRVFLTTATAAVAATSAGIVVGRQALAEPAAKSSDTYPSNTALYDDPKLTEGVDYQLRYRLRSDQVTKPGPVGIVAPHGGRIEAGTSELAIAFAGLDPKSLEPHEPGAIGYDWWMFEAINADNYRDLHVTSTHCDDKIAEALCARSTYAVGLHGCSTETAGLPSDAKAVLVGGRDEKLHAAMMKEFKAAGIEALDARDNDKLSGTDPDNICNRTRSGGGVQLEITRPLRASLFGDFSFEGRPESLKPEFWAFVAAGRKALAAI